MGLGNPVHALASHADQHRDFLCADQDFAHRWQIIVVIKSTKSSGACSLSP